MSVSLSMSTKVRIFIVSIVFAVLPFIIFSIYARDVYENSIINAQGKRFEEEAIRVLDSVLHLVEQRKLDTARFSQNTNLISSITSGDTSAICELLAQMRKRYGTYSSISIVDGNDKIIASSQSNIIGQSVAKEVWISSTRNAKVYHGVRFPYDIGQVPVSVSGVVYDSLSSSYGINFSVPIIGGKSGDSNALEEKGFLLVSRLHWNELFEKVNEFSVREGLNNKGAFAVLYDDRQNVIAAPEFLQKDKGSLSLDGALFSKDAIPVNPFVLKLKTSEVDITNPQKDGLSSIVLSSSKNEHSKAEYLVGLWKPAQSLYEQTLGWSVAVMQNKDAVLADSYRVLYISQIIVGLTVLVVCGALLLLFSEVKKQLKQYGEAISAVEQGDYSTVGLDVEHDSTGLSQSIDRMSRALDKKWSAIVSERQAIFEADKAKSELIAYIGQELRSPLHGIIEIADVLMESASTNEQRSCAKNIVRSATSLLTVAHNMVDVNLLQRSRDALVLRPYDLYELVGEVTEVLALTGAHRGIELVSYYSPQCPRYFVGYPARVQQIVTNMTSHVIRSTLDNQVLISVHCRESDAKFAEVWVTVESSGMGLERENLEYLWKEGVDGRPVAFEYKEIGLDLILSKQIAQLVDGDIGCFGIPGSGSEICWLSLFQHCDLNHIDVADGGVSLNSSRVLIAVSNSITGRLLEKVLSRWNAMCVVVTSPDKAWLELDDGLETGNPYSFVVTSKGFGDDGQGFVAKMYANRKHAEVKTIFLSSLSSIFDATSFGKRALVKIVHMPFDLEELKQAFTL